MLYIKILYIFTLSKNTNRIEKKNSNTAFTVNRMPCYAIKKSLDLRH